MKTTIAIAALALCTLATIPANGHPQATDHEWFFKEFDNRPIQHLTYTAKFSGHESAHVYRYDAQINVTFHCTVTHYGGVKAYATGGSISYDISPLGLSIEFNREDMRVNLEQLRIALNSRPYPEAVNLQASQGGTLMHVRASIKGMETPFKRWATSCRRMTLGK